MWNLKENKLNSQQQRVEWSLPGAGRVRETGRCWSKGINISGDLVYTMVNVVIVVDYILRIC